MSQLFTHKGFRYELKENQGFYHCLVYEQGREQVLYQTKFFGSAERAKSTAMKFIRDYIANEEAKLRKVREEVRRKAEKEKKKEEKRAVARSSRHMIEKNKEVQAYEPMPTEPFATSLYPQDEVPSTPIPTRHDEARTVENVKPRDTSRKRSDRAFNTIILLSALLLIVTGIVYAYSTQFADDRLRVQDALGVPTPGTVAPVIELPEKIPTLEPTETPTAIPPTPDGTTTTTITVTPTSTSVSTEPPPTP